MKIENAVPASFSKSVSGYHTGPPLTVETESPESIKDTLVLYFASDEAAAAKDLGLLEIPPEFRPIALQVPDCRRIVLACLHFMAEAGDEISKDMLGVLDDDSRTGD